ncbi:MAG: Fur family transcriptional regulator [Steroidobacteraceae bacterium]|jgi:Fur family iron response transcriptional regulator
MIVLAADLAERLKNSGVLPTAQRLRIAAVLLASPQHLTAEQILSRLREGGMRVSKATVYNTLKLFAAKGVIRQLAVNGDRAWFDSNTEPHYHFQDLETGALTDLAPNELSFDKLPPPPPGMEYAGVELFIRLRRV